MTNEEKQLLLIDLCARLPYEVKVLCFGRVQMLVEFSYGLFSVEEEFGDTIGIEIENIKPYLRPMSNMTDEEREEFRTLISPEASCAYEDCLEWDAHTIGGGYLQISVVDFSKVVDWLNEHHFDYHGMIEKGLALEAPKDMYKN